MEYNNGTNLPKQPPVFTPPADGQGLNPPREVEKQPQRPQVDREKIYESWHNPDIKANNQEGTATMKDGEVQVLSKLASVITKVFFVATGVIFGLVTIAWILRLFGSGGITFPSVLAAINFVLVFASVVCMAMLCSASSKITKFNGDGRYSWMRVSLVLGGIAIAHLIITVCLFNDAADTVGVRSLWQQPDAITEFIKMEYSQLLQLAVVIVGWIILTRKSVKAWFD
jgi:hypothetical protein